MRPSEVGRIYRNLVLSAAMIAAPACAPSRVARQAPPVNTADLSIAPDSVATSLLADVRAADSTIRVEMRYLGTNNFTGAPLPGYEANRALLRREAAAALARAQARLRPLGLGLLVYDAYRPVRATQAMMEWTRRTGREDLVRDGYIAARSRHNLGLAIDLTLASLATGQPLDMGTEFDTFSSAAHTANATGAAAVNRATLKEAMESAGFRNYAQEWWHYSFAGVAEVRFDTVVR